MKRHLWVFSFLVIAEVGPIFILFISLQEKKVHSSLNLHRDKFLSIGNS